MNKNLSIREKKQKPLNQRKTKPPSKPEKQQESLIGMKNEQPQRAYTQLALCYFGLLVKQRNVSVL